MNDELKEFIKKEIVDVLKEDSGRRMTSSERAKDELQTAMLSAAYDYIRDTMWPGAHGDPIPKKYSQRIHSAYSELEDLLVDAMMGWEVPGVADEDGY